MKTWKEVSPFTGIEEDAPTNAAGTGATGAEGTGASGSTGGGGAHNIIPKYLRVVYLMRVI